MAKKLSGIRETMRKLIKGRYSNATVLTEIKKMFPNSRTRPEQVRAERQALRERCENIPTSVEARRAERQRARQVSGK